MTDDFEDLLDEAEVLEDASTVSLTGTAANMSFAENSDCQSTSFHSRYSHLRAASPSPRHPEKGHIAFSAEHVCTQEDESVWEPADNDDGSDCGPPPPCTPQSNAVVIEHIEQVYEEIVDALLNEKAEIGITLKIRTSQSTAMARQQHASTAPTRRVCFPGRTADESWRFSVVVRILELMHQALRKDTVVSKRDIYYQDPLLFGHQKHVDRYVDDIAFTFGVSRSLLNVTAVAKGLVAGAITFCRRDGAIVNAVTDPEGLLIPNLKEILSVNLTTIRWILVVEKEATFRSITASKFWQTVSARGVVLTGKGYPDLGSRALLRLLSNASAQNGFASPPVFGLADFDPDGIAILSTYRHGSKALNHETEYHAVPRLQWLGLRSEHLQLATTDTRVAQGLLPLSARDRKKAAKMLEETVSFVSESSLLLQKELQTMLMLNLKAELQLFDTTQDGIAGYLHKQLDKL